MYDACAQAVCARPAGLGDRVRLPAAGADWGGGALAPATRVALRAVLERAAAEHAADARPWLRLAAFELAHGTPADVARVHARAVRTVADGEAFSERYGALLAAESG